MSSSLNSLITPRHAVNAQLARKVRVNSNKHTSSFGNSTLLTLKKNWDHTRKSVKAQLIVKRCDQKDLYDEGYAQT